MTLREETERGRGPIAALILAARNDIDHDLDAAVSGLLAAIEAETADLRAEVARLQGELEAAEQHVKIRGAEIARLRQDAERLEELRAILAEPHYQGAPIVGNQLSRTSVIVTRQWYDRPTSLDAAHQEGRTDLRSEVAALRAENERLRQDAERLDWLASLPLGRPVNLDPDLPLREAIDASRQEGRTDG